MNVQLPPGITHRVAPELIARPGLGASENARRLDQMFQDVVRSGRSFTGGDGVYSTTIGGRTLFQFGDTYVRGRVGNWRLPSPVFRQTLQNHSLATLDERGFHLHVPGAFQRFRKREFLEPPGAPHEFYWPAAVQQTQAGVQLLLTRFTFRGAKDQEWGFRRLGTDVATLDPDTLALLDITRVNEDPTTSWGAATLADGARQVIYGAATEPDGRKLLTIAHTSALDLREPWTYLTEARAGAQGVRDAARAARFPVEVANQFSVLPAAGGGVDVLVQRGFEPKLTYVHGATPEGPFDTEHLAQVDLPRVDAPRYVYNSLVHPALSDDERLLVSVNHNRVGGTALHAREYVPRFFSVPRPGTLGVHGHERLEFGK